MVATTSSSSLAQPDHEPRLGDQPGRAGPGQHGQAAGVAGRGPHRPLQAGHRLDVVVQHVGPGREDRLQRRGVAPAVRDRAPRPSVPGVRARMASMVCAMAPAPPSARSSRATQVTTAWPSCIRSTASATRSGSSGVERQRVAGVDLAEAAGPGAALAVDHEGGRAVGPALVDVGAARFLAHRDQPEVVDGLAERAVLLAHAHRDPQPLGLACSTMRDRASGATPAWRRRRSSGSLDRSGRPAGRSGRSRTSWRSTSARARTPRRPGRRRPRPPRPWSTVDALGRAARSRPGRRCRRARCGRTCDRSQATLRATPCSVRRAPGSRRTVRTPMAAILRGVGPSASIQTPGYSRHRGGPGQAEVGQRGDHDLFQPVHVGRTGRRVVGHRHDRVGHQLAGPVVGDVAAPVGLLERGANRRRIDQHVASDRRATPSV